MYNRQYHLDSSRFSKDINQIEAALMGLKGVSDVSFNDTTQCLSVTFEEHLSEKQILSTINLYKCKH